MVFHIILRRRNKKFMTCSRTDRKCVFFWWAEHLLSQLTWVGISREQKPGLTSITGLHPKTQKGKGEDAGDGSMGLRRSPAPLPTDGQGTPSCPCTLCWRDSLWPVVTTRPGLLEERLRTYGTPIIHLLKDLFTQNIVKTQTNTAQYFEVTFQKDD